MGNELELTKVFNEKVFERIRESIGDLMSPDDLKLLVNAAMQKAFFTDEYRPGRYHDSKPERVGPPLIVQEVQKLLDAKVRQAVDAWLLEHDAETKQLIDDALSGGIFKMIANHIENKFSQPMHNLRHELLNKGLIS